MPILPEVSKTESLNTFYKAGETPFPPHSSSMTHSLILVLLQIEYERRCHLDDKGRPVTGRSKVLIIPSSGNLGISLATFAARHRYQRVICIVPERTSHDRVAILKALGVEILRSPNEARPEAPESATSVAARLADQLSASSTVAVLDETTFINGAFDALAEELYQQTEGRMDYLFVGVESGATISGLSHSLKAKLPTLKVGPPPPHTHY